MTDQIYAPGVSSCPNCKMRLIKAVISMKDDEIYADDSPARCLNGCGPLWRVTWKEEAQENMDLVEQFQKRIAELEAEKDSIDG